MKRFLHILFLILLIGLLWGCAGAPEETAPSTEAETTEIPAQTAETTVPPMETAATEPPVTDPPPTEPPVLDPALEMLNAMTLHEKVGQLFIVRPDALDFAIPLADVENAGVAGITDET